MGEHTSKAADTNFGTSETVLRSKADQNNMRMAGNARNVIQDMYSDAYRVLSDSDRVVNARSAIDDVSWYVSTGRASLAFEGAIGAMTKDQQRQFIEGLSEDFRSRDGNVKKAKQLIRKIKPDAGESKRPAARVQTEEERRRSEAFTADYNADRYADAVRRKYGK